MTEESIDTLDSILDLAVDVLRDYGGDEDSENTRIARLARFVAGRLGGPPYDLVPDGGSVQACLRDGRVVTRTGDRVRFGDRDAKSPPWPMHGMSAQAIEEIVVGMMRIVDAAPVDN